MNIVKKTKIEPFFVILLQHCAPVNATCRNDIKMSSKTAPEKTPSPHSSTTDPIKKDAPTQNEKVSQKVNHQRSPTKARPTTLGAHKATSSHVNSKETAGKTSTQTTIPLSQSPASVPLRSVKPKRKRRLKATETRSIIVSSANTAINPRSKTPMKTQSATQTSPTSSATMMRPNSTMLPGKKEVGSTVMGITVTFAVIVVGLGILLHGCCKFLRARRSAGKNF